MTRKACVLLYPFILLTILMLGGIYPAKSQPQALRNYAFINGRWFDGKSFEPRTLYSVDGRFTTRKPARVDRTLDLAGTWVVPPFAEAHNHNIDGVSEERDRRAIQKYVADGVFYVKIQGNFPLSDELRGRLPINRPDGPDVALAQTFLTAAGGHPIFLHENILMGQGYYPGLTKEMLKDKLYFTVDSEADLERKWPLILALRPDFIKTNLWASDEFEKRKDDPAYSGRKGLDPRLLQKIVARAHADKLRVSVHVTNAADFHHAVAAGADEITHLPLAGPFAGDTTPTPISAEDAKLAAKRGVVVITTVALLTRRQLAIPGGPVIGQPEDRRAELRRLQAADLKLLLESGVAVAIGSDNVADSSVKEFEYLGQLGVYANLTLLKMWTEVTAKTIFPRRKIGALREGYEASFLALEGDPLEDLQNVRRIKMRFKQGFLFEP